MEEEEAKEEQDPLENDEKMIWTGFFTRNKKQRTPTDAYCIRGEGTEIQDEHNLNISHRLPFEDLKLKEFSSVIVFVSSDDAHEEEFALNYHNYFKEKNRAGMITTKDKHNIYIVPSGIEEANKWYKNDRRNYMVGLLERNPKL